MSGESTHTSPLVSTPHPPDDFEFMKDCKSIADFRFVQYIGGGSNGAVVEVKCVKTGHPNPDKSYTLKVMHNRSGPTARRSRFGFEFQLMGELPHHPHIIPYYHCFNDVVPMEVLSFLPPAAQEVLKDQATGSSGSPTAVNHAVPNITRKLYGLFGHCPHTLAAVRARFGDNITDFDTFIRVARGVLSALVYLESKNVLHRDLSLNTVQQCEDGSVCLCDFGEALHLPDSKRVVKVMYSNNGGNAEHCAPEVLIVLQAMSTNPDAAIEGVAVDYSGQATFEAGVLLWEIATGNHPIVNYPVVLGLGSESKTSGDVGDTCVLTPEQSTQLVAAGYPEGFVSLVRAMIDVDPAKRPTLSQAIATFNMMFSNALVQVHDMVVSGMLF